MVLTGISLPGDKLLLGAQSLWNDLGVKQVGFIKTAFEDVLKWATKRITSWHAGLISEAQVNMPLLLWRHAQDIVSCHFCPLL